MRRCGIARYLIGSKIDRPTRSGTHNSDSNVSKFRLHSTDNRAGSWMLALMA
ncbi:Hypothetical protein CAP_7787 [Chondromyces apiculatus DSM 436]|uniref:Uncharacterized protein n=1 Tax=Chondromyces apiculatus DSM 436 TaxID=1192034 RepID=A0A017SXW2_9BACT|nr:Hypothetical protein CAP_7787 [Chondromyces apiculatus DSM 436]